MEKAKKDVGRKSVDGRVLGDRRNGQQASVEELSERLRAAEGEAINFKSEAAVMKEMVHTLKVELRQKDKTENELRRRLKRLQESSGEAHNGSHSHRMR
jgi:predicted RNase H-like nuclease (RuvC/YqgF family)